MKLTWADQLYDDPRVMYEDPSEPRQMLSNDQSIERTINSYYQLTPEMDKINPQIYIGDHILHMVLHVCAHRFGNGDRADRAI